MLVTPRGTNPSKALTCGGLRVALVLDESASIPQHNATETVRGAALAFARALSETNTDVAIIPSNVYARGDLFLASGGSRRATQRKPMWLMPVSMGCGRRAAGR